MCNPTGANEYENKGTYAATSTPSSDAKYKQMSMTANILGVLALGLLISTVVVSVQLSNERDSKSSSSSSKSEDSNGVKLVEVTAFPTIRPPTGVNPCEGANPKLPNVQCIIDGLEQTGEQAATNVTKGYNGRFNTSAVPIKVPYWQVGLCPVNVHWHLGTEHYSAGEFDEFGSGPTEIHTRRELAGEVRQGFQCRLYDDKDPKFTTKYDWKHCEEMEVGQTYEVHWPHSAAGACGTLNQYQTPFYDGVFCNIDLVKDTAGQVGVQAQIFTIVNDESYYYPDLMRGMIVDKNISFGTDLAMYTGSTTGETRNNTICSGYTPITWQVDRKCRMVSASAFDKMCADMKAQRDDMSADLHAHGSRPLVADIFAANNQVRFRSRY